MVLAARKCGKAAASAGTYLSKSKQLKKCCATRHKPGDPDDWPPSQYNNNTGASARVRRPARATMRAGWEVALALAGGFWLSGGCNALPNIPTTRLVPLRRSLHTLPAVIIPLPARLGSTAGHHYLCVVSPLYASVGKPLICYKALISVAARPNAATSGRGHKLNNTMQQQASINKAAW